MSLRSILVLAACTVAAVAHAVPETTPSGLIYESLKEGGGTQANPAATVQVHYRGTLANGTEFDSSYKRGQAATFPLSRVIPAGPKGSPRCGRAAGQDSFARRRSPMAPGALAGDSPDATLTFEVELLKVNP